MPATKACAVPGCGTSCKRGQLMCRDHWFQVSTTLRGAVNRAWAEFRRADPDDREQWRMALAAYRSAVDAAVIAAIDAPAPVPAAGDLSNVRA